MKTRPFLRRHRGFSLVITMGLMLLLLLLAVGMLSLSTVTLRAAGGERDMATARANARMALILAIGDLQKYAGIDQAVTAAATLLDSKPETTEIDDVPVSQQQWAGVWHTGTPGKSGNSFLTPYLQRRDNSTSDPAGLVDTRPVANWSTPAGKSDSAIRWLVSNPTPAKLDPSVQYNGETEKLFSSGGATPEVRAPLVPISTAGGAFAWWTSDEGVKANLAIDNAYLAKKPDFKNPDEGYTWLTSVPGTLPEHMDPDWSNVSKDALTGKLVSFNGLKNSAATLDARYFHDYTAFSMGILADSERGGLRQDLSAYLNAGDQAEIPGIASGLNDRSNLIGPRDAQDAALRGIDWNITKHQKMSPRFGLLKSWGELAQQSRSPLPFTRPQSKFYQDSINIYQTQADFDNQVKASIKPLLVEGSIYYAFGWRISSNGQEYRIRTMIYPRVVLWNPYNVPIQCPEFVAYIRVPAERIIEFRLADNTTTPVKYRWPRLVHSNMDRASVGTFSFLLEATTFQPGECLVFSKKGPASSTPYNDGNVNENLLSATNSPGNSNFYREFYQYKPDNDMGNDAMVPAFTKEPIEYKFLPGGYIEDLGIVLKALKAGTARPTPFTVQNSQDLCETIQLSSYHHAAGDGNAKDSVTGWADFQRMKKHSDDPTPAPYFKTRDGARLRWMRETQENRIHLGSASEILSTGLISQFNVRHALHLRTPREDYYSGTDPKVFGDYIQDVWSDSVSWGNISPIRLPSGNFGGNPFAACSSGQNSWFSQKYVLLDVPHSGIPLVSFGQFQHAPVSPFSWSPTYAIANSWADPRVPVRGTSPAWSTYGGWNPANYDNKPSQAEHFRDLIQRGNFFPPSPDPNTGFDQLLTDVSYEVNNSLWDRFYLSGANEAAVKQYVEGKASTNLPNARLRLMNTLSGSGPASGLQFHHAAKHLGIVGAFNVNSTSVDAWKAWLLSTVGASPDGLAAANAAFPRLLSSANGPADGKDPMDPEPWSGYRSLTPAEVDRLAKAIVQEVKIRGPFLSLSDFVNRRLASPITVSSQQEACGRMGTLQAAIDRAELNSSHDATYKIKTTPQTILSNGLFQDLKATHITSGATGYLQQGDILQPLGPGMASRSDTFKIRTCGQARDKNNQVTAKAYCEAIIQRTATPLMPDSASLNPDIELPLSKFGRQFQVVSFRWISPSEI